MLLRKQETPNGSSCASFHLVLKLFLLYWKICQHLLNWKAQFPPRALLFISGTAGSKLFCFEKTRTLSMKIRRTRTYVCHGNHNFRMQKVSRPHNPESFYSLSK